MGEQEGDEREAEWANVIIVRRKRMSKMRRKIPSAWRQFPGFGCQLRWEEGAISAVCNGQSFAGKSSGAEF
jgi:hypothetical protein